MVDTYLPGDVEFNKSNTQRGGSYFLPKHVLRVTVKESEKEKKRSVTVMSDVVPDRDALVQIGFNLSPLSFDDIKVEYDTNGLIKGIAAVATDKTGDIIVQLAKTVSGFRATTAEQEAAIAIFEFDPFNWEEAAFVNAKLAKFEACVEVELHAGIWSAGCRPTKKVAFPSHVPSGPGIYYRRPVSHRVHVIEKGATKQFLSVEFANTAPVFRIDIDRTTFVERKTTINFVHGVPTLVQVVKPSEGLAIAELPLTIAKAIIAAPVEGLSEHKKVQTARSDLYTEEAKRIQAEQKLTSLGGIPRTGIVRSGLVGGSSFDRQAASPTITTADCRQIGLTDPQDCAAALGR